MLKKLRKKLKNCLICGDEFHDAIEDIMDKKEPDSKKLDMLLKLTGIYITYRMEDAAKFATWENYYEKFTINGKEDRKILNTYLKYEYGNHLYQTIFNVAGAVDKLKLTNPDRICQMLLAFKQDAMDFKPGEFYAPSSDYRRQQLIKASMIAKAIEGYCEQQTLPGHRSIGGVVCYQ